MSGPGVDGTEGEWADGRSRTALKPFPSRRLQMAQCRESSVSPLELLGPCQSLTRGEPSLQVAELSPLFHPGGLCLELLPGNRLARVRETFLGQRGNYLAHSSVRTPALRRQEREVTKAPWHV